MAQTCTSSTLPPASFADAATLPTGEALVDDSGAVWLPHDIAKTTLAGRHWSPLSSRRPSMHAGRVPFCWSPPRGGTLSILNGMGVTLGDSVIGLGALAWLKQREPNLRIEV